MYAACLLAIISPPIIHKHLSCVPLLVSALHQVLTQQSGGNSSGGWPMIKTGSLFKTPPSAILHPSAENAGLQLPIRTTPEAAPYASASKLQGPLGDTVGPVPDPSKKRMSSSGGVLKILLNNTHNFTPPPYACLSFFAAPTPDGDDEQQVKRQQVQVSTVLSPTFPTAGDESNGQQQLKEQRQVHEVDKENVPLPHDYTGTKTGA